MRENAARKASKKASKRTPKRTPKTAGQSGAGTLPAGHLEARLWLRMLSCVGLVEQDLRNRLRQEFDITLARFDVLTQLGRPPTNPTMSELSHRLMVTKGSITDVVGRLEIAGLVERRRDARDSRVQRVHLTPAGQELVDVLIPAHHAWISERFGGLGRDELEELAHLLGRMRALLRPEPGGRSRTGGG